jgi:hypothetical protein
MSRRCEQARELLLGQPVRLLMRFRRRLEVDERIGHAMAPTDPTDEPAK